MIFEVKSLFSKYLDPYGVVIGLSSPTYRISLGGNYDHQGYQLTTSDLGIDRIDRFAKWNHVPSGYVKIAIENGHRNSGFSH